MDIDVEIWTQEYEKLDNNYDFIEDLTSVSGEWG
jgi:hypothetical protein